MTETLTSERIDVELDPRAFAQYALDEGWGDGLPCVPPVESLVREYLDACSRPADALVAVLPPSRAKCTVENIAVNAAMTGAPPAAMDLVCTMIATMAEAPFDLPGVNATTASVVPAVVVNGPIRDTLRIPYREGCLGGALGWGASIGRAARFVMRNIAGQAVGETSASVFGQPGRITGIVTGEWEERSPWAPLAERRGVPGDAITVFAAMGTANIADPLAASGEELLHIIGRSLAYMGTNGFLAATSYSEMLVGINPTWTNELIHRDVPDIEDVQRILWERAIIPLADFPAHLHEGILAKGRVHGDNVHVVAAPEDIMVFVAGGSGSIHAAMLPGFSNSVALTRPVS
jgi:hypothetical protein